MPILLSTKELAVGMTLSHNVSNQHNMILKKGHELTESDISSLRKYYPDIMVHVGDPILDEVIDFEDESKDIEVSQQIRSNAVAMTQKVSGALKNKTKLTGRSIMGVRQLVSETLNYLSDNPVTKAILEQVTSSDEYSQVHGANVFYLSVLIGNSLKNYIKRERERLSAVQQVDALNLKPLALSALLFDIGMMDLQEIHHKDTPLDYDEMEKIRLHPLKGVEMLPEAIEPMVKLAVRCHHENMDGTGYPMGLMGSDINIFSRIIRVADAYSSATSQKIYKQARSPIKILHEMLTDPIRKYYDPVILKVFSDLMQPLPLGAKLKTNTGLTAVVVKHHRGQPFNPDLMFAFDAEDNPIPKEKLLPPFKLDKHPDLKVLSFANEDIRFINGAYVDFSEIDSDIYIPLEYNYQTPEIIHQTPNTEQTLYSKMILDYLYP